jgi:hypothetical protein
MPNKYAFNLEMDNSMLDLPQIISTSVLALRLLERRFDMTATNATKIHEAVNFRTHGRN